MADDGDRAGVGDGGPRRPDSFSIDADARDRLDEVLAAIENPRRRDLLYYLDEFDLSNVEELAEWIATRESDAPPGEVPDETRQRVRIGLTHTHLPKLADVGVIDFDRRSGAIRCQELPSQVETLLDACESIERDR